MRCVVRIHNYVSFLPILAVAECAVPPCRAANLRGVFQYELLHYIPIRYSYQAHHCGRSSQSRPFV